MWPKTSLVLFVLGLSAIIMGHVKTNHLEMWHDIGLMVMLVSIYVRVSFTENK